jgi:hypothetical protein
MKKLLQKIKQSLKMEAKTREVFEMYSNLAFSFFGLLSLIIFNDVLVCVAFQSLSVGSYIFHKYKTEKIFLFDWWAMHMMNTILTGHHLDNQFAWVMLILIHIVYSYKFMGKISVYKEVAFSAVPALLAIFYATSLLNGSIILAIFLLAIWIRSKDPDPKQAKFFDSVHHSYWHILAAFGYFLAFWQYLIYLLF